ncbi:MAG: hypothetical protein Q8S09_00085 [Hyphomonas sp.]|nr:hypothetical protein [Hyphomonas sp.]
MVSLRAFRSDPHFADLFVHVHVICWPILWWQLNILFRWCKRHGHPDVLYSVNDWGFITVRHFGATPDPTAYKPVPRTLRPLTDPGWGSDLPSDLEMRALSAAMRTALFLPREAGGGGILRSLWRSKMTEGALPSPPNTS